MTAVEVLFALVGAVAVGSALMVVTTRQLVHAALWLVVTLGSVAALYLLLSAEFVAWVQILIYVGAIVILFLFGLMLTKAPIGRDTLDNNRRWLGALVAIGVFAGLVFLIQEAFPFDSQQFEVFRSTTQGVGESMFRDYVLPFEAISFLLLAALIGAIVLARKDEGN